MPTKVLSIQSHVVSGYVGNRAATFPLQLLGYDVDVINTVQFSNHTGYGHTDGHKTSAEHLRSIFSGLRVNGLARYDRVLSGYVPGAEALAVVEEEIGKLSLSSASGSGSGDRVYVLDPVMGDTETGLYVAADVVPVYKRMLHMATIITPNQFEAELLSDTPITSLSTLHTAISNLRTLYNVPNIVITSIPAPPELGSPTDLVCISSSPDATHAFVFPKIDGYFSGVGDLFSAMVLARYNGTLHTAVGQALMTVQRILQKTSKEAGESMQSKELHIISSQGFITDDSAWPSRQLS